jgi:DnaK suppressor protein
MDAMDAQKLQQFRSQLEIRQHELHQRIEQNQRHTRGWESEPDIVDQAANESEKDSFFGRNDREHQLLQGIESALGRVRSGSCGECGACGEEINQKRLEAIPWTAYCIQCEEVIER